MIPLSPEDENRTPVCLLVQSLMLMELERRPVEMADDI